jgi:hypothetical protein
MALGALEEAEALIEIAGPENPELFRRYFDIGLLLDRTDAACAALRENAALSPTLPARIVCLARDGDWNAAEITLTLGRNVGEIDGEQEAALARFLDPEVFEGVPDPPPPEPSRRSTSCCARRSGCRGRPATCRPAFLHKDLADYLPMRGRIEAAETLVLNGAIAPATLFAAYRAGPPAASGGLWDRAAAIQALDAALAAAAAPPESPQATAAAALRPTSQPPRRARRRPQPSPTPSPPPTPPSTPAASGQPSPRNTPPPSPPSDSARLTAETRMRLFELLLLAGLPEEAAAAARPARRRPGSTARHRRLRADHPAERPRRRPRRRAPARRGGGRPQRPRAARRPRRPPRRPARRRPPGRGDLRRPRPARRGPARRPAVAARGPLRAAPRRARARRPPHRPRDPARRRSRMTAATWLPRFLEAIQAERDAAHNTLAAYARDLTDFAAFLAGRGGDLATAGRADIEAYLADLDDRGMARATRARRLSAIRQLYHFAFVEGWRGDDPAALLKGPRRPAACRPPSPRPTSTACSPPRAPTAAPRPNACAPPR